MISAFSSARSGLSAFANQIAVVAHNVANVHTEGFEASRAVLHATYPSGVAAHIETLHSPESVAIAAPPEGESPGVRSNVDLTDAMTTLLMAHRAYQANLNLLKAEHERVGHLLDLTG